MPIDRLRNDVHYAILVVFGIAGLLGIAPFAVYRFLRGDWLAGAVDTGVVAVLAATLAYLWRGGSPQRAAIVFVANNTLGCMLIAVNLGLPGVLWTYPALVSNFLMTSRRIAIVAAVALIVGVALFDPVLDALGRAGYVVTAALTSVFSFLFAQRTHSQRRQLERLATHDALTGLYNRRAMESELAAAAETFRRHRLPVALAVLDMDHFKRINDAFGHEAGDQVLVRFARIVQGRCRASDRFFRYGGEEFVLLLPGAGGEGLRRLLEELRTTVETRLQIDGRPVTVSIGAASLRADESVTQWLARADAALYRAKDGGRNRVELAEDVEDPLAA